jgi:hypothetical protein
VVTEGLEISTDYFRVGYGEAVMPAALDALTAFVQEHQEAWRKRL